MKRLLLLATLALLVFNSSSYAQHPQAARKSIKQGVELFGKNDLAGAIAEYDRAMEQFLKSADDEVQIAAARTMSEIARTYMPEMPAIYRLENYFVHGWVRGFAPPIFTSYWKYLDIDLAQRRQAAEKPPR